MEAPQDGPRAREACQSLVCILEVTSPPTLSHHAPKHAEIVLYFRLKLCSIFGRHWPIAGSVTSPSPSNKRASHASPLPQNSSSSSAAARCHLAPAKAAPDGLHFSAELGEEIAFRMLHDFALMHGLNPPDIAMARAATLPLLGGEVAQGRDVGFTSPPRSPAIKGSPQRSLESSPCASQSGSPTGVFHPREFELPRARSPPTEASTRDRRMLSTVSEQDTSYDRRLQFTSPPPVPPHRWTGAQNSPLSRSAGEGLSAALRSSRGELMSSSEISGLSSGGGVVSQGEGRRRVAVFPVLVSPLGVKVYNSTSFRETQAVRHGPK